MATPGGSKTAPSKAVGHGASYAIFKPRFFRRSRESSALSKSSFIHGDGQDFTSLQKMFNSLISSNEPASVAAIRGPATTTAKHFALEVATLMRFWSRKKPSPREPYSPKLEHRDKTHTAASCP